MKQNAYAGGPHSEVTTDPEQFGACKGNSLWPAHSMLQDMAGQIVGVIQVVLVGQEPVQIKQELAPSSRAVILPELVGIPAAAGVGDLIRELKVPCLSSDSIEAQGSRTGSSRTVTH